MNWPEIAILLLPVASLSGYLLGRRGGEKSSGERVDQLSKQYFQGLNHLLNEEQDQAIALFERIADDDTDRFETQLALGSLFRRRGELERAIRLHQDLSVKAMLSTEQRSIALLELGDDFVRAGLLDRAEALFDELLAIDAQSAPALKQLIGIASWHSHSSRRIALSRPRWQKQKPLILIRLGWHCWKLGKRLRKKMRRARKQRWLLWWTAISCLCRKLCP
jgi:lipopolysaccharide assembly protein B